MKETRMNQLTGRTHQHPVRGDESVAVLLFGAGEQHR
jgi:hypothetical protein